MTDRELVRRIERSPGQRAGYKQLVRELGLGGGRERRLLVEQLMRLTSRGVLVKIDRDSWSMPAAAARRDNLFAGRLDLHRDGFGFVRPEVRQGSSNEDIFIPPNEIGGAMQGDQVLVEIAPPRDDGRRLGRIVRILSRKNPTVVGIFHYSHNEREGGNLVVPFDDRMTQPVIIPFGMETPPDGALQTPHRVLGDEARAAQKHESLEGLVVDVEITDWPTANRPARGRVLEILGDEDDFGVDVEMVIRKHHLPHVFPEKVLEEARQVAYLDHDEVAGRRDFRDLPIVTIDGETARDFDDAVLVRENGDGTYELQVHIADVAHYVVTGSDLDLEARLRGNSVYFPDRAIPMLPQELSTDICSLRPGVERLVLSCIMQIDHLGDVLGYEICEGVIRSARRMTYTQVHAVLEGDEAARAEFATLVPEFERMKTLALMLNKKRQRRGSIDFDLPEPIIEFNESGAMQGIVRSIRNWAHRLIEEFMLSANECVATWLEQMKVPSIYRIHEKPDAKRVVEFEEIAAGFGYSLGIGSLPVRKVQMRSERREQHGRGRNARQHEVPQDMPITPRMYQKLAMKISGKPEERILAYLMLRSLKQARYSEKNEGHFALAAPCYTHFTSPIRRYPDLVIHRLVKAVLSSGAEGTGHLMPGDLHAPWHAAHEKSAADKKVQEQNAQERHANSDQRHFNFLESHDPPIPEDELDAIADECSKTERRAAEAERELVEWKKIKFMKDRVGEDFDGMIMSVTKYGLFVELEGLFVEGLVPIDSLRDDRYTYRENTRQLIGEHHGQKYSLGERVRVLLDRVDGIQKRLQFSILEELEPKPGQGTKKSASEPGQSEKSKTRRRKGAPAGEASSRSGKARKGTSGISRGIQSGIKAGRKSGREKARLRNRKKR